MKRKQLTLFLEESEAIAIEEIRKKYNPGQHELIRSHITLCREDEIGNLEQVKDNLENLQMTEIDLRLGSPRRFAQGKGVLIPMLDKASKFQKLRTMVLKNVVAEPREHKAHITLMHPRNSTCNDQNFQEIQQFSLPTQVSIAKISLIEQEIGKKWNTVEEYDLRS